MTESELIKRITDMRDENRRYEKEIADLEKIVERLDAEKTELKDIKADLEDKNKYLKETVKRMNTENMMLEADKADLEGENRHLTERVKLLEHKRDELIDELKRVGGDKERDIVVGQLMAYRQMFKMILDRGKE